MKLEEIQKLVLNESIKDIKFIDEIHFEASRHTNCSQQYWLEEGLILYLLAKNIDVKGEIVEIGTWSGCSASYLAAGTEQKVYTIDPAPRSDFNENLILAKIKNVVYLQGKSEDVVKTWKSPIKILHIDGSHDLIDVRKDCINWEKFVVVGGVIVFHDVAYNKRDLGPALMFEEVRKSGRFDCITTEEMRYVTHEGVAIAVKVK